MRALPALLNFDTAKVIYFFDIWQKNIWYLKNKYYLCIKELSSWRLYGERICREVLPPCTFI